MQFMQNIYNLNSVSYAQLSFIRTTQFHTYNSVLYPSVIGKVVASHVEGCRVDSRLRRHRFILLTRRSGGTAHEGEGRDQSSDSTVSDAIVRCWLWSTATRIVPNCAASVDYCK